MEVSPSIVVQNDQEDITESFIVSPDTADYDDDDSPENPHLYNHHGKARDLSLTKRTSSGDDYSCDSCVNL